MFASHSETTATLSGASAKIGKNVPGKLPALPATVLSVTSLAADLNGDCYVGFLDFAVKGDGWLNCGNPFDASCD